MAAREFAGRAGRAEVNIPVHLKTDAESFFGVSKNIGMGGLFVATNRRCQVGDRLAVTFTLPEQSYTWAVGVEVRWIGDSLTGPSGIGVRFVNPPVMATVAIHEFLREREAGLE